MTPTPCPYAITCLASRLPSDDICQDCKVREPLERGAAERDAFLAATYPRPSDPVSPACQVVKRAPVEDVEGAGEPDLLAATREAQQAIDIAVTDSKDGEVTP